MNVRTIVEGGYSNQAARKGEIFCKISGITAGFEGGQSNRRNRHHERPWHVGRSLEGRKSRLVVTCHRLKCFK